MRRKLHIVASGICLALVALVGLLALLGATATDAASESDRARGSGGRGGGAFDALRRLAADYAAFGFEVTTAADPLPGAEGGLVIYDKDVLFLPPRANVVYVTIGGTGDTHGGQALGLACRFDGATCNPGPNPVGFAPPGWINLLNEPIGSSCDHGGGGGGDCHDNGVYYTWCVAVDLKRKSMHNVEVRIASIDTSTSDGVSPVFMEGLHFFVDANFIRGKNRCTEFTPPDAAVSTAATQER